MTGRLRLSIDARGLGTDVELENVTVGGKLQLASAVLNLLDFSPDEFVLLMAVYPLVRLAKVTNGEAVMPDIDELLELLKEGALDDKTTVN